MAEVLKLVPPMRETHRLAHKETAKGWGLGLCVAVDFGARCEVRGAVSQARPVSLREPPVTLRDASGHRRVSRRCPLGQRGLPVDATFDLLTHIR